MTNLSELARSRELLANLTLRELKGRYKRSTLGWAWSLLNPLGTMLIFSIVFRLFLRIEPPVGSPSGLVNFAMFLLCGLLPWNMVSASIVTSIGTLVANGNLIKKVWFPREILVASTVLALDVTFLIELGVLTVALLLFGNMVLPWLPVVLLLVVLLSVFAMGIGMALSVLNVYFRDISYLMGVLLQFWFYATPVVYPVTLVPEVATIMGVEVPVLALYRLNPMVHFVEAFRDAMYDLRFPSVTAWLVMSGVALASFAVGSAIFTRFEPRLAEEL